MRRGVSNFSMRIRELSVHACHHVSACSMAHLVRLSYLSFTLAVPRMLRWMRIRTATCLPELSVYARVLVHMVRTNSTTVANSKFIS